MGGSFSCSGVRDAYGSYLEEGDYVECTTTGGAKQSLGRVKYIHEDRVTFQWPVFGTYTYTDSDIRYYGVSKVMGDRDGYKFKMDQIVELLDGTEAWVSLYSPQSVTLNFGQMGVYDAAAALASAAPGAIRRETLRRTGSGLPLPDSAAAAASAPPAPEIALPDGRASAAPSCE
eukprot:CAMPEP_0183561256 /NCGR_PEP_ID=MMETSP0371-20130417/96633_1 /TAXON_ID=268820 /ORGANISM="Peridinium aciculiferum, Strain PAER-2" /LENGTH=173 /DNA_ID=CAMNT_0025769719 /DNA_START=50 /DNA_END=572 /DNA_ORIENTATION=-